MNLTFFKQVISLCLLHFRTYVSFLFSGCGLPGAQSFLLTIHVWFVLSMQPVFKINKNITFKEICLDVSNIGKEIKKNIISSFKLLLSKKKLICGISFDIV